MRRIIRATCAAGILLGGTVSLFGFMGIVGLVTDNLIARLSVALVLVVCVPAFVAERLLKRFESTLATKAGLGVVADAFAIVLLALSLGFVAADGLTKRFLVLEGDRYARTGPESLARLVYFVAGVSPVFPGVATAPGAQGASASASASSAPGSDGGTVWRPEASGH
jgi:hypothetical protein